jgi:hypothetical protein
MQYHNDKILGGNKMEWDSFKPEDHAQALNDELLKTHSKTVPVMPQEQWTVEELDASDEVLEGLINTYMDENRSEFERDRAYRRAQKIIETRVGNAEVIGSKQMFGDKSGRQLTKEDRNTGHGEGYAPIPGSTHRKNADIQFETPRGQIDNRWQRFSKEGK